MTLTIRDEDLGEYGRVLIIEGIIVNHPNIQWDGKATVTAVLDINVVPPRDDEEAFERWAIEEATAAIRTKDDGQAIRPSIWPDGTEHDVRHAWYNPIPTEQKPGHEKISVWPADIQLPRWLS